MQTLLQAGLREADPQDAAPAKAAGSDVLPRVDAAAAGLPLL